MKQNSIWWIAPEYFSRWRLFPRAFISMYIYLLFETTTWFMALEDPNNAQAGLISVIVGAGAAWFGLYVNSTSSKHAPVEIPQQTGSMPTETTQTKVNVDRTEVEVIEDEDTNDLPPPKRNLG
tara:strand:- start:666 stop:1034 length:369 start_codon:yes stop_codon:yes gene_type:complete